MANEQLRSALARAGIEMEDLAAGLGVDAKTVQRWLGGRVPHARYRARIAETLGREEHDLWPDVDSTGPRDDRRELAGLYIHGNDMRAPDWRTLMPAARDQIDLLDVSLAEILTAPGTTDLLAAKAADGIAIRILIAHPKSIWVTALAEQLGDAEVDAEGNTALDRQISHALAQLSPLAAVDGIEVRTFWAERTLTVRRFDDQMLVTQHLYRTPGQLAPLMHLRRRDDGGLFDRFAAHFQRILEHSSEPVPTDLARLR